MSDNPIKPQGDTCGWYEAWEDETGITFDVDCVTDPVVTGIRPGTGTFNYCPNCGRHAVSKQIYTEDDLRKAVDRLEEERLMSDTDKIVHFKRELRYYVMKVKDVEKYLNTADKQSLELVLKKIRDGRRSDDRGKLECVVVEDDWPEYKQVWEAITERCLGIK